MMRVLLVGAKSTLARALKPQLAQFAEVVTAGRSSCDVILDLAGEVAVGEGFDAVINTAAHLGGKDADAMVAAEHVNVTGLLKLCRACTASGVGQLVQVSSILAELPATSPFFNVYALSKRQGDEAAQLYAAEFGLRLAIIRPSQLYGVGEAFRRNQPFLYTLMDKAQAGEEIVIYGANDALRNFIHVDDVARLIALVVQQELQGLFSCAHPHNVRYSQIAQAAIDAFGSTAGLRFATDKPDIPDKDFAPDDTLFRALGYTPQISIEQGIRMEAAHRIALL